ncbi:hypothetical protein [Arenibaculum pallidiluteum]|uniref:hypothetical protein n=1 Tax=Arenibaculum pallidiluteum TaxID=2812559 RepID=UPI001A979E71|nr:hypothetical protein [Arenibaculum pallidiluteum]
MRFVDLVTRSVFALVSLILMLLAAALIVSGAGDVLTVFGAGGGALGSALLEAVGYTIIAIAIFDVAKYLLEEEAIRGRELRHAGEARRSLTKFISTITIAVFLEALVAIFEAAKQDMAMMLYPTLLLFCGVLLVVGLGIYQRLSASAEAEIGGAREEARDEAEAEAARQEEEGAQQGGRVGRLAGH